MIGNGGLGRRCFSNENNVTSALPVDDESDPVERFHTLSAGYDRKFFSRSNLDEFHLIIRYWLTTLAQNIFMQRNCFFDVGQRLFASPALADTSRQTWDLHNDVAIFPGAQ